MASPCSHKKGTPGPPPSSAGHRPHKEETVAHMKRMRAPPSYGGRQERCPVRRVRESGSGKAPQVPPFASVVSKNDPHAEYCSGHHFSGSNGGLRPPLVATPTDGSSSVSGAAHGSCGEDLKQHPGRVGRPLLATLGPPLAKCIVRRCTLAQLVADDNGKCISA